MSQGIARGLAIFLGGFSLLNVIGGFLEPNFDASIWWIDFRPLPAFLSRILLLAASLLLLAWALRPQPGPRRLRATRAAILLLAAVVAFNCLQYYIILFRGEITTDFPFPFSVLILLALIAIFPRGPRRDGSYDEQKHPRERQAIILSLAFCIVAFPLSQIFSFGRTDYQRPADAIVVFGARTYSDGQMSQALYDRTRTGVALINRDMAEYIVFSGGPGDGKIHETEAMRRFALGKNVPPRAIVQDRKGLNTRSTVRNTVAYFQRKEWRRVMAVSHYFHLPRIKMAYQRAGFDVYTVPADETYILYQTPYLLFRETVALWYYYLRPLFGSTEEPAELKTS